MNAQAKSTDARGFGEGRIGSVERPLAGSTSSATERPAERAAIRVVHVAPTAFGGGGLFGGGERYPLELAGAMARLEGVRCELVTFGPRPQDRLDDSGLRVRILRPLAHLHRHPAHPVAPALIGALAGADVIHAHHLRSTSSRMAALASRIRRRSTVVTDHGLQGGDWSGLLPRLFDRFLAVSHYAAAVSRVPASKSRVVYGGADTRRFVPEAGARRDGVLFVGRLTPHKGVDRLVRALPSGASLTIVGTSGHDPHPPEREYPNHLRSLADPCRVRFVGPVNDTQLGVLYRRAAVMAVPSVDITCYGRKIAVSELFGLSALEAMASGTPVVASRLGGLSEVVVDGVTGFLVEPGNVGELHDRLRQLLADSTLARRMGDNARDLVLERFTWPACAERCLAAYRQLLD
jgi:glycosyltransferase involved in cell wall biosynthesis